MKKQYRKKAKKFIKRIRKEFVNSTNVLDGHTIDLLRKNILDLGDEKLLSFALISENNQVMEYIYENSSFEINQNIHLITDREEYTKKIRSIFSEKKIKPGSFYDLIVISVFLFDCLMCEINVDYLDFNEENLFFDTPVNKCYLNSLQNFSNFEEFIRISAFILLLPTQITLWLSIMMKKGQLNKQQIELLESVKETIYPLIFEEGKIGGNEQVIDIFDALLDVQNNIVTQEMGTLRLCITYITGKISSKEFYSMILKRPIEDSSVNKYTSFIWENILKKIYIDSNPFSDRIFINILCKIYPEYRTTWINMHYHDWILRAMNLDLDISTLYDIFKVGMETSPTELELSLFKNVFFNYMLEIDQLDEVNRLSRKYNIKDVFCLVISNKIEDLRSNEAILNFIEIINSTAFIFKENIPLKALLDLEQSKINNNKINLETYIKTIIDDEKYDIYIKNFFLNKLALRYQELNYVKNDFYKEIFGKIGKRFYESAVSISKTKIKNDEMSKEEIKNTLDELKSQLKFFNKHSKISKNLLSNLNNKSVWWIFMSTNQNSLKLLTKIERQFSNEPEIISHNNSYFMNIVDFILLFMDKKIEVVKSIFERFEKNNIKFYFLKTHIKTFSNELKRDNLLNEDAQFRSVFTINEEIKMISIKARETWENQFYWMLIDNINKIFFVANDTLTNGLKYYFEDTFFIKENKTIKTLPTSKIINGKLQIMISLGENDE